jgi:enolase-phosphatase E1
MIWEESFQTGKIKGHVYSDVPRNLKKWTEEGKKVYIYSSGSISAQKLLFTYSCEGNLTQYLSGFFDTSVGFKQETESYLNILKTIECDGKNVMFLSDIPGEVIAARKADIKCMLLTRENNAPLTDEIRREFQVVSNFDEISL